MNSVVYNPHISIINYIYLIFMLCYHQLNFGPLEGYPILAFDFLILLINWVDIKTLISTKPIGIWALLCVYAFANYYINPICSRGELNSYILQSVFEPLLVMIVCTKEYVRNPNKTLWICLIAIVVQSLLLLLTSGDFSRADHSENFVGNTYSAVLSLSAIFVICLKKNLQIKMPLFVGFIVIIFSLLLLLGSRKTFGSLIILLVVYYISGMEFKLTKILGLTVFAFLIYFMFDWLVANTYLGERMIGTRDEGFDYLPSSAPEYLTILGNRAPHYYYGWLSFLEYPIFGHGLFSAVLPTNGDRIHSEYLQQLTYNGLIGFCLWITFYVNVIKGLIRSMRYGKEYAICLLGACFALLFISITSWTWCFNGFFLIIGIMVGWIYSCPKL